MKFPAQTDASNSQGYTAGYGNKLKKQIGTLEEILALRCVCFTLRQQLHECLSPDQGASCRAVAEISECKIYAPQRLDSLRSSYLLF